MVWPLRGATEMGKCLRVLQEMAAAACLDGASDRFSFSCREKACGCLCVMQPKGKQSQGRAVGCALEKGRIVRNASEKRG